MTTTLIAALAVSMVGASPAQQNPMVTKRAMTRASAATTNSIIAGWLPEPQKVAKKMIAKYGQPNEATDNRFVWWGNGPWKYTILVNEEIPHSFPMPHKDLLRQVIDYRVPANRVDDLAMYDGSVIFDRTPGELSARCDKEEANFLAINLAHDVVTGKRNVTNARTFYANTVSALMKNRPNAEQKRYTSGFIFKVPMGNTGFKDKPHKG